ncbi:MAG: 5-formyltetrahydrofolate cyclo-ligase [Paludibacteraceae bacterium]|nr:5-formyltetrahydrofolate cyclo-ligase [Paludibacteraceae bacterium]MBP6284160.1 5-formyltetrahydrofolate cyclo-ligase [Paludibacteraceae bacterium]
MNTNTKQAIRQLTKVKVLALSVSERIEKEIAIFTQIEKLSLFREAKHILCFWALPDEVNTAIFIRKWHTEKQFYLPVVKGDSLVVKPFTSINELKKGAFAINEPTSETEAALSHMDMIIVPGVAFDTNGNRLGRGKGFYDKLLCQQAKPTIGLAYKEQIYESLPTEKHDIKLDMVISA